MEGVPKKQQEKIKKETFIISTAQRGARQHDNFLKNLEKLKEIERAKKISLFVTQGTHKNKLDEEPLDDYFLDESKFDLINDNDPTKESSIKTSRK